MFILHTVNNSKVTVKMFSDLLWLAILSFFSSTLILTVYA